MHCRIRDIIDTASINENPTATCQLPLIVLAQERGLLLLSFHGLHSKTIVSMEIWQVGMGFLVTVS